MAVKDLFDCYVFNVTLYVLLVCIVIIQYALLSLEATYENNKLGFRAQKKLSHDMTSPRRYIHSRTTQI